MRADIGRLRTGIGDLDLILGGGLEPGSLVILAGAPGTGKTILAQQICFANATLEHKALYYTTLSEPHTKLVRHLEPFDFFKPEALEKSVDFIHLGEMVKEAGKEGLEPVVTEVVRKCFETRPAVVVIDSAKALRDFVSDQELRTALYDLASRVAHTEALLILVGEYTPQEIEGGIEFSLADGIFQLAYEPHEPVDRRWLRVVKLRGGDHLVGKHSFRIGQAGFEVFPRLETLAPNGVVDADGPVASGVPRLDGVSGGRDRCRASDCGPRTVRRREDHPRAPFRRRGPRSRRALPLRFVPGNGRAAHQEGRQLRLGHGESQGIWSAGHPLRSSRRAGPGHHRGRGPPGARQGLGSSRGGRPPCRVGVWRPRGGTVSRLFSKPGGMDSGGWRVRADHQRNDHPRTHDGADRRSVVPVPQRHHAALPRNRLRTSAGAQHHQDANQQPRQGRIRVCDRQPGSDDQGPPGGSYGRSRMERLAQQELSADSPSPPEKQPEPEPYPGEEHTRLSGAWTALVIGIIALVLILIFILQNLQSVEISFLLFHGHLPLAVALLFAVILGAVIVLAFGGARINQLRGVARRARRQDGP